MCASVGPRTVALALVATLCGCAFLRSGQRPLEEWTFVAFAGSEERALIRTDSLAATSAVAVACAAPDTVTFAVEPQCGYPRPYTRAPDGDLLLVTNWTGSGYRPDIMRAIMSTYGSTQRFAGQASALAQSGGYKGVLLDFRLLGRRDVSALVALVTAVADSARAAGIAPVGIVVPAADTAAYPGRHLGAVTNFLAVRVELEPATPDPASPRDRMARHIGARAAEIGAHRILLLVPADGYLWRQGEQRVPVSYEEAVATAHDWGVELTRDETSSTLRARAPGRGELWVNDAELIAGIVRDARRLGIRKFGLYGLGGEDPAIWPAIAAGQAATP